MRLCIKYFFLFFKHRNLLRHVSTLASKKARSEKDETVLIIGADSMKGVEKGI
jgi:hypothetical protein